jgi:hypothetical protein
MAISVAKAWQAPDTLRRHRRLDNLGPPIHGGGLNPASTALALIEIL